MRPYLAIVTSRFLVLLQYRAAAIAGVGTQLFFGLVRMMVFEGFYRSSSTVQPLSAEQAITYIWLGQAMILLTMPRPDKDVATMIETGNVAYELTRPVDLYATWFARSFSSIAAPLSMRAIPIIAIAGLFFGLALPASVSSGTLFVVSMISGLMLAASIAVLLTISMLWTISGEGVSRIAPLFVFFFSGIVIPLPFLPDSVQTISNLMPFRGLLDTPLRIYMGHLDSTGALLALAHQLVWFGVLVMTGRMILSRGLGRMVVHGG